MLEANNTENLNVFLTMIIVYFFGHFESFIKLTLRFAKDIYCIRKKIRLKMA